MKNVVTARGVGTDEAVQPLKHLLEENSSVPV